MDGNTAPAQRALDPSTSFAEDPERTKEGDETGTPGPGHNSAERLKSLNEMIEEHCDLQDKEDKLLEKYIEPVREKKSDVKAKAKKDFDIPTEAFNARAALRRIERRKDGDEVVLALNELFQATPVGHNLDLVALAEKVSKKKVEKAAAAAARKNKVTEGTEAKL